MTDGLSWEAIGVLGVMCGALIGLLLSIRSQLSSIATKVDGLAAAAKEDRAEHTRLWAKIDDHEKRIGILE